MHTSQSVNCYNNDISIWNVLLNNVGNKYFDITETFEVHLSISWIKIIFKEVKECRCTCISYNIIEQICTIW